MSELHEIDGIIFGGEKYTVGEVGVIPEGLIDLSEITWWASMLGGGLRDVTPVLPESIYDYYTIKIPDIDANGNYITEIYRYGALENSDRKKWKRVTFPSHLEVVPSSAFKDGQLEFVEFGDHVTSIENFAFDNNQITSLVIPDSVTSIGAFAFGHNPLTEVSIGPNTTYELNTFPSSAVITVRDE